MQRLRTIYNGWRLRAAIKHRDSQPKYSPEWLEACARVKRELDRTLKGKP